MEGSYIGRHAYDTKPSIDRALKAEIFENNFTPYDTRKESMLWT
jgi:hypothetical protein